MPLGRLRPVLEVAATPLGWCRPVTEVWAMPLGRLRPVLEAAATPLGRLRPVMEVRPLGRHPPGGLPEPDLACPLWLAWRPRRGTAPLPVEVPVVLTLTGRARYLALGFSR
jgi:hypothetical protein